METTSLVAAHDWVRNAEFAINTDAGGGTLGQDGRPMTYGVQGAEKTYRKLQLIGFRNPGGHSSRPRRRQCDLRSGAGAAPDPGDPLSGADQCDHAGRVSCPGAVDDGPRTAAADALRRQSAATPRPPPPCSATRASSPRSAPPASPPCSTAGHAENALPQRASATVQLPHLSRRHGRPGAGPAGRGGRQSGRRDRGDGQSPA